MDMNGLRSLQKKPPRSLPRNPLWIGILIAFFAMQSNAKGKMSYMNADDGISKVVVVIPKTLPPGDSSGVLVLDNGIGLAVTNDPSQP
jgi:hypothetical protein